MVSYAALVGGIASIVRRAGAAPLAASAIAVVICLIWLTWPVWLSPYLTGPHADAIVARLVWVHPLFTVNGVLMNLGTWSHLPIAYRDLTTLGQDVPYALPTNIWPSVLTHFIPGFALLWAGSRRPAAAEPAAGAPSSAAARS